MYKNAPKIIDIIINGNNSNYIVNSKNEISLIIKDIDIKEISNLNSTDSMNIENNIDNNNTINLENNIKDDIVKEDSIPFLYQSNRGIFSFKLLTECPLVIMLLFQTYPYKYMQKNAPLLLPNMLYLLAHNPPINSLTIKNYDVNNEKSNLITQQLHEIFSAQVNFIIIIYYFLLLLL